MRNSFCAAFHKGSSVCPFSSSSYVYLVSFRLFVLSERIDAPNRQSVESIVGVSFFYYELNPQLSSNDEFVQKDFDASLNLFIGFVCIRKPSRAFGDV